MVKGTKNTKKEIEEELSDVSSEVEVKPSKKTTASRKKSADKEASVEVIAKAKATKPSSKVTPKKNYSDDSDSESDKKNLLKKKQPRKTSQASKKSSKKAASSDSESEKPVKAKKTTAKKATSDSESEEKPKKSANKKKAASSDSESEQPKKASKQKKAQKSDSESDKPVVKSVTKQTKKKAESSDSESEIVEVKKEVSSSKPTRQAQPEFSTPSKTGNGEGNPELFVKGLSYNTTEEGLKEYLSFFGEVSKVRIIRDRETQQPRGIAFVEFTNPADTQKVANYTEDLYLDGRSFKAEISKGNAKTPSSGNRTNVNEYNAPSYDGPKFTIFCGNLGFKTTPQTIEKFFHDCKPVDIRIALQEDGRRKGFAHIDFKSEEDRKKALTRNGKELDGRELKLDESAAKQNSAGPRQFGGDRRPPMSDFDRAKKAGGIVSAKSKALKIADSDSD